MLGVGWFPDALGGLDRYFRDLLVALEAAGERPTAVVLGPAPSAPEGVVVAGDGRRALAPRLWAYWSAARRGARAAGVVDSHFALHGLGALPVIGRAAPMVVHFHGPWAAESRAAGERGASALLAKRQIERVVYRRATALVVLSGAFRRILVERYGVSPWGVRVIPPGVDLARFSPGDRDEARERLGLSRDDWIVLSPRRLVPRMGIDVLIEAWSRCAARDGAALAIVGDGPHRRTLEGRARALGVADSIDFLGRVSDDDLVLLYRSADLCVVPSRALEGFGLVVLEALECGTPVIATDVGGLPEALAPLDRGLIVPADDAEALARRIDDARAGVRTLPSSRTCRAYAERFTWARAAREHRRLYRGISPATAPARTRRTRAARVVVVGHCAQLSGAELALLRLLPALRGVEPHVILAEDGPLVSRLQERGVSVEVLPMASAARGLPRGRLRFGGLPARSVGTTAAYVARLARRLRRLSPDLVHTNSLKAALYGGAAARVAGVPVIWHLRDRIAEDYLPAAGVRLVRAAGRRLPHGVIAVSRAALATLDLPSGGDRCPSWVIYDPVEPQPERPGRAAGPLRVGMVGRIAPWKGQALFLRSFAEAFPSGSERAVLVGAPMFGEQGYEATLRHLTADLGLGRRVAFEGFKEDVATELGNLDVLVHASVIPEPLGQVVMEGMAAGLAVVAPAVGGPSEIVEDGVTGLLYPPGDTGALARALTRLAESRDLREELGVAARRRSADFVPQVAADQVTTAYAQTLARIQR